MFRGRCRQAEKLKNMPRRKTDRREEERGTEGMNVIFTCGGTALAIQLAEMGVVLSVSRQMPPG